jgi:large subunit ribosomal protein L6
MSRIGKMPIELPDKVTITVDDDNLVTVKGPKGELSQQIHKDIKVVVEDGQIKIERPSNSKPHRSLHGLSRSLINNMVEGVVNGFKKKLEINGV